VPSGGTKVTPLAPDDPRTAWPLYTIHEAAKYLGLPNSTLRSWVRPDAGAALVHSFPKEGHHASIPFVGFAEAFVLAAARRAGVPRNRIRAGVEAVSNEIGVEYALANKRLYVDKAELLVRHALDPDPEDPRTPGDLTVARNQQMQMTDTVRTQLQLITYGGDDFAETIQLPIFKSTRVIVDPKEAFGQPFVERTGTRVRDVLALFWAEEDPREIAYDFDLREEEVFDLIRAQTKPASD
jgi:uncharacterized protein (DUF433 family)